MNTKTIFCISVLFTILFLKSSSAQIDYASGTHKTDWSSHFAFGSPSWDNFVRYQNNPVYRGNPEFEWPVNGFFYSDPVSKNWYLYIGEYREGYYTSKDCSRKDLNCVIYKSADKGRNWKKVGDLFPLGQVCYDSIKIEAPDVMVVYADGKYHMVFDWTSCTSDWEHMENSGLGYAVADSPEGPFVVTRSPLKINTCYKSNPILNRYWRMYAPMLVKRKNDWVLLHMMDMQPTGGWALAYATSASPEGPYSESKLLRNVEQKTFYPPLQEYFPAFTHAGYTYIPATSVSLNRDFQFMYRVKTEDVTNRDKRETVSENSIWHSLPVENEYSGIWGQTINGFIDDKDSIYIMYPSRDKNNLGTINLARASWKNLEHKQGFSLSAPNQNSFSYIKKAFNVKSINVEFGLTGTMHLIWNFNGLLDIKNGWGEFDLSSNKATQYNEVVINKDTWEINSIHNANIINVAKGTMAGRELENNLIIEKGKGNYKFILNGKNCWEGTLNNDNGFAGICLDKQSYISVKHFIVNGNQTEGELAYGFCEALLNSGFLVTKDNQPGNWIIKEDSSFLYNQGAISANDSASVKWNFSGKGFKLYAPKGPGFNSVSLFLDGKFLKTISLKNNKSVKSSVVYQSKVLKDGNHAVYIETKDGKLPVDCIKVKF